MKLFSAAILATAVSAGIRNRRSNVRSCEKQKRWDETVFKGEWKWNKQIDTCILSKLMGNGNLVREQLTTAINFIDKNKTQKYAQEAWSLIINDWKVLAGAQAVSNVDGDKIVNCGFKDYVQVEPAKTQPDVKMDGYTTQCGLLCAGLGNVYDAESGKNAIKTILNGLITIINDQFAVRYPNGNGCMYDETKNGDDFETIEGDIISRDGWINGYYNDCTNEDICRQLIVNTHHDIAVFEEILDGYQFPNLDRQFLAQNESLTELNPNGNGFFNDLYRTGIYGVSKFIVPSKRQSRIDEWLSRFPNDRRYIA